MATQYLERFKRYNDKNDEQERCVGLLWAGNETHYFFTTEYGEAVRKLIAPFAKRKYHPAIGAFKKQRKE